MKKTLLVISSLLRIVSWGQEQRELAIGKPNVVVDLKNDNTAKMVNAQWSTVNAEISPAKFKSPGPSAEDKNPLYPTGKEIATYELLPKVGTPAFESAAWENVAASSLETRKGNGLLSHVWYHLKLTLPTQLGSVNISGERMFFEIVADDYSEIWVNGKFHKTFGDKTGQAISGYNARQRVLLTNNAKPGDKFELDILVTNGPMADLPDNYVWIRSATLDFYKEPLAHEKAGKIITINDGLKSVVDPSLEVEKIAGGFQFTEGPVWHPNGFLLFSDPNTNVIYKYDPGTDNVSIYMTKTGYTGVDIGEYHQPGSNGLGVDKNGCLVACQHGNRRIVRFEKKGPVTVLSDSYEGKKLNSPNDLVIKSDGTVYFTDPPYGLPDFYTDKRKEQTAQGVYRIKNGKTELLTTDLGGPNGLAFSPDEKYLYVTNWDIRDIHNTKTIWRYEVTETGLKNGKIFFDMNQTDDEEALDGLKIDSKGNLFASAPGGVWIISPEGKYLGKIVCTERPANMAWGDDGKTLYMTAHSSLYKIKTLNGGIIAK